MSGYDVLTATARSIGQFWSMSRAGIYRELARLERLGYIIGTEVAQHRRPDKRIFEPTELGREAFANWLQSSQIEDEGPKVAYLVRLFFARSLPPERIESMLNELDTKTRHDLDELADVDARLAAVSALQFERLTARHGIYIKQARLRWIAEVRIQLGLLSEDSPS